MVDPKPLGMSNGPDFLQLFFLYRSSGFSTKEYQFAGMVLDIKDWMSGGGTELLNIQSICV
jgi:hypothetical protein